MNPFKRDNPGKPQQPPAEPAAESPEDAALAAEALAAGSEDVNMMRQEMRAASDAMAQLQAERDEAIAAHKHALADFANYQRRAMTNEQVARQQGAGAVVMSVANVIDHFDIALNQDLSKATPQTIADGVRVIRDELLKALQQQGVSLVTPKPNDEFVPGRHEAVMQQPAEGVEHGHVSMLLQSGYQLGDRVLRPAKVAVAP